MCIILLEKHKMCALFTQLMKLLSEGIEAEADALALLEDTYPVPRDQLGLVCRDGSGDTPIIRAIKNNFFVVFNLLIEEYPEDINLSHADEEGNTVFILLAKNYCYNYYKMHAFKLLDKFGESCAPHHKNKRGFSGFCYLGYLNFEQLVRYQDLIGEDKFPTFLHETFTEECFNHAYTPVECEHNLIKLIDRFRIMAIPPRDFFSDYCWSDKINQDLLKRIQLIADSRPSILN